ncbi:hypothetical protein [Rufibacter sp. XAAS-G3-1]|uniref:hypothetical protein n=1 Tax=Rufibacter sp. XAAS-G3-1 TaxID=2729134 RepID=UPI0015E78374|nr:hypothetical protein [Rufibacter sp. XAAS-G3-1]
MASYTTKAYLKAPDSKGLCMLHVRYTYKRIPHSLSLNVKIERHKFDSVTGMVKTKYGEASSINLKIRQTQQLLEDVADTLPNPDFAQVKPLYEKRLSEIEEQKKEDAKILNVENRKTKITNLLDYLESLEIPERKQFHINELKKIEELERELNRKGYRNESHEDSQIRKYLEEYPNKFFSRSDSFKRDLTHWIKTFLEFVDATNTILTYDVFNYELYNSYAHYLMFAKDGKQYYNNFFGSHVNKLKSFLKWLEDEKDLKINKGYKKYEVVKEKKEIIYLTEKELDLLWEFKDTCNPSYVKYIDLCLFGNYTGLRYSDIKRSYWWIDNEMLQGKTQKTDGDFNIPLALDPKIEEILKKYKYNLNLVSVENYNKTIKKICKEVFELHQINTEPIQIKRERLKEKFITFHYKHELLSSHSNRRGFCTRLWQQRYTEPEILLMLGSVSSVVLRKYVKNTPEDLLRNVKDKQADKAKIKAVQAKLEAIEENV